MRIRSAESLRVPEEGSSTQGKSGPKARPKGVVDGQQVDIPVPPSTVMSEVVTQEGSDADGWICLFKQQEGRVGKSARCNLEL